ncbi:DUF2062 domain-containing protein [Bacillaceae bacterium]
MNRWQKWKRFLKLHLLRMFRSADGAHRIALGFALGVTIHFAPTFGFGPAIAVGISNVFRANPVAGFAGWLATSWAWPLLFLLNYYIGDWLLGTDFEPHAIVQEKAVELGASFFLGMVVNEIFAGTLSYLICYWLVCRHRETVIRWIRKYL